MAYAESLNNIEPFEGLMATVVDDFCAKLKYHVFKQENLKMKKI